MITQLGIIAGEILNLFEDIHEPLTVKDLAFYLDQPEDMILLSLGSLIREGLVKAEKSDNELLVCGNGYKKETPLSYKGTYCDLYQD